MIVLQILSVKADGFKNLKDINFEPFEKTNIIFGENAQGKTNLIEAIWIAGGVKSFRGTKDKDFIDLERERAEIEVVFRDSFRTQTIKIKAAKPNVRDKTVLLNGVSQQSLSKLFGKLSLVIFTPEDLELAKGSPENRRIFCDLSISQIMPSYRDTLINYNTILAHRNNVLKNIALGVANRSDIEVWDFQLARHGSYISMVRYNYVKKLNIFSKPLYDEISRHREELELLYNSTVFDSLEGKTDYKEAMSAEYRKALDETYSDDLKSGFTQVGPHRDDIIANINGLSVREFGSQGQNRSVALIMKLAQAYILFEEKRDEPVILLDDVLSELDEMRQEYVREKIKDFQIFITCCKRPRKIYEKLGLFEMKDGRIEKDSYMILRR